MQWILLKGFFSLIYGASIGSFLNVVISRLPEEKSVVKPGSHCPQCKKPILWRHNIPLLSFLWLRGRCHNCGWRIPTRYFLVELLMAILMLAGVFLFPYWPYWPFLTYFFGALLASTFIDLDHWIIPDRITLPGIIIGFIGSFFHPTLPWLSSLLGILFGGGIFLVVGWLYEKLAKREGIGGGDVKFLAMIGAFLGFRGALITLILSSVLGSIIGLGLMWKRGRDAQMALPFGPFLALGALGSFFLGDAIWQWYFQWRI